MCEEVLEQKGKPLEKPRCSVFSVNSLVSRNKQGEDVQKGCEGCTQSKIESDGHCYMFVEPPEQLPCAQHDMFYEQRKQLGSLVRKNPQVLAMIIASISR